MILFTLIPNLWRVVCRLSENINIWSRLNLSRSSRWFATVMRKLSTGVWSCTYVTHPITCTFNDLILEKHRVRHAHILRVLNYPLIIYIKRCIYVHFMARILHWRLRDFCLSFLCGRSVKLSNLIRCFKLLSCQKLSVSKVLILNAWSSLLHNFRVKNS